MLVLVTSSKNVKRTLETIWLVGPNVQLHKFSKNYERNWTFSNSNNTTTYRHKNKFL